MAQAKIKISLPNGSIELEGDEQFVRYYLDEFKGLLIKTKDSTPKTSKSKSKEEKIEKRKKNNNKKKTAKKAPKVVAERFDIHGGDDIPSLQNFIDEKKPGKNNGYRIAVIGYYITEILGNDTFSVGNIEYAYKMLKLKRPNFLNQIIINNKNRLDLFEQTEEGENWSLARAGEILVTDKLPENEE